MSQVEAQIQDFLASNLTFLSNDFRLIRKEFYLKNLLGTRGKGFIDILAEDSYQHFVIIEIKRSNQTAREAIHEILKYAGLLKRQLKVKETEIRICIVSTDWDELIVPFSELHKIIPYHLEGFKIQIDSRNKPIKKEFVKPLEEVLPRNISHNHMIFLYENNDCIHQELEQLRETIKRIGIEDFVLLEMSYLGDKKNIIYPHGIYFAFQRYEKSKIKIILLNLDQEYDIEEAEEFSEGESELLHSLEQAILSHIRPNNYDTLEASYPDKFLPLIEAKKWKISKIIREGIFADDPRGERDSILLSEIKGTKGKGFTQYHNYSNSKFKLRLSEIEENSYQYLYGCDLDNTWLKHLKFIFSDLKVSLKEYELFIDIYNPGEGLLKTLYNMYNYRKFDASNPLLFMPNYILQIHFDDPDNTSVVYVGKIKWDGTRKNVQQLLEESQIDDLSLYFTTFQTGLSPFAGLTEFLIMNSMGFEYSSDVYFLTAGEIIDRRSIEEIEDGLVAYVKSDDRVGLEKFINLCPEFMCELNYLFCLYLD
jgi:hypothetical protein